MHVLYFLKQFPKLSESFVLNEIHELTRRGHDVAVFARQNSGEMVHHEEFEELDLPIRYAKRTKATDVPKLLTPKLLNVRLLRRSLYRDHPNQHVKSLDLARQCIEFVDDLNAPIDHIHSHFAYRDKIAATYVAAYYDVPSTVTAHAYELYSDPDPHALGILFDRADRILVPSRYNRSYLREHFGVTKPIDVVPATTRVSKFESTGQAVPNRLLTVARLIDKKGIDYAIEALARVVESHPSVEYHIVGTGEREDALRARARELGVLDRVRFLGNVSDERLQREYNEAAVFVLPSVITANGNRDSSPVALKEAMAMTTPCVSTTVAGIPELIEDGSDGLLVEPRDVDALTDAITVMLENDDDRNAMGRNARRTIHEEFSLDVAIDELLASFERAISHTH